MLRPKKTQRKRRKSQVYPEFDNEEIKDIATENGAEPEAVAEISETAPEENIESALPLSDAVEAPVEAADQPPEVTVADAPAAESEAPTEATEALPVDPSEPVENAEITEDAENADELPPAAPANGKYLLYGGTEAPEGVNYEETLKFLVEQLKYDGGELRQAREKKDGAGIVEPDEKATEFCSYCGLPISGVDYYRLPDGRKRCTNCNRSLVKSVDELNSIFNTVILNMELFFGAVIDVPIKVEMIEERKMKKKLSKGLGDPPKNALILGVAVEEKGKYTVYVENGIPRASLISTLAHELTHIWQYTHWNVKNIKKRYGSKMRLIVYEGMAMWTEIQYLYHIGESTIAKREELNTIAREDEYGVGFNLYVDKYPLATETMAFIETPFAKGEEPLD